MKSREEIQKLSVQLIEVYLSHESPVALARLRKLEEIKALLEKTFPISAEDKKKISLLPLVFQECNYDGDELANPKFTLVKDLLDFDFYIAFDGQERTHVSVSEFWDHYKRVMNA